MKAPESKSDSTCLGLRYQIDQSNLTIPHFKTNTIQLFDAAFIRNHWIGDNFDEIFIFTSQAISNPHKE